MPYIGRDTDKISNVEVLDNITFDGSSSYTLQKGGSNFTPSSANTLLLSIDGVVQAGNFTVSGSTIDFGTAVAGTSTCDFVLHYGVGLITTVSDGTVTEAKIGANAVTAAKLNNDIISGTTALTSEPADTDEFLVSDAGTLKRIDYSLIKATSPGMTLLTSGDITSTTSSITIGSTYVNDTYDNYQLWIRGKAAGDGIQMNMRYRNNADTGNVSDNYSYRIGEIADNGNGTNSNGNNLIRLTYNHPGNNSNEGFNMVLNFMSPRSNLVPTACMWSLTNTNTSDDFKAMHGAARRNDGTEKHSGFILFFNNGGDFANGTHYEFYGMKK
jgi:hypothetical protein